jgi:protein tyrosine phosphatase (PTP) superfamily phosphohydrolase (DUF442 family)
MRAVVFVLAMAASAVVLGLGCAHAPPSVPGAIVGFGMPGNLHCFQHEHVDGTGPCVAYRSAQPSAAEFSAMAVKLGLRSVVKLNSAIEARDEVPGGVEEYHRPWLPVGPVDRDDIAEVMEEIDLLPKPLLVHCTHGIDRTGLAVALWRVRHGVPAQMAWREWRSFPRSKFDALLYAAFERETGYHIPDDER